MEDVWAQAYPVNQALYGGWNKDVSCGDEEFDAELQQKRKSLIVPPQDSLKIDHFAAQNPHPSCKSDLAFQIMPDDPSVILRRRDLLNQKGAKVWQWCMRFLIGAIGISIIGGTAMYVWVQFCVPVLQYFSR
ncbi:MAG: hypothetical protein KR126chlam3_00007 [Chlamydiae bacterium]|nr:hypothetical protein [Chlamydiota bacterium]